MEILPIEGLPEVRPGDDLAALLLASAGEDLAPGDVLVVTHKVVSKAEGRLVDLREVRPSPLAKSFAARHGKDPRHVEVVLRESRRIVRMERGLIISETHHGFVCANAGVDASNVPARRPSACSRSTRTPPPPASPGMCASAPASSSPSSSPTPSAAPGETGSPTWPSGSAA